jgi:sulfoxide reductase catalytic subunit YedY
MLIKNKDKILSSEITDQSLFLARRQLIKAAMGAGLSVAGSGLLSGVSYAEEKKVLPYSKVPLGPYSAKLETTEQNYVESYTNYYEFSTGKSESTKRAQALTVDPWSVSIEGEVENPGIYHLEDILKKNPLEERIYRFRCVEAWSMVVPWIGFPLAAMLKQFKPTSKAKYVEFTTLYDPKVMPGQSSNTLEWPYVEGLRLDEAMNPLTLLATGMYDDKLPKQNGAPLRLIVPWKYGFKSIKAIVKIRLTEQMPKTAWNKNAPDEYGFFANVNPEVAHPRWSQAREKILGGSLFSPKRKTEMFNGYGKEVAHLYANMDLTQFI